MLMVAAAIGETARKFTKRLGRRLTRGTDSAWAYSPAKALVLEATEGLSSEEVSLSSFTGSIPLV
jgi:hypothetical protein